jgi:hypothetical protein
LYPDLNITKRKPQLSRNDKGNRGGPIYFVVIQVKLYGKDPLELTSPHPRFNTHGEGRRIIDGKLNPSFLMQGRV